MSFGPVDKNIQNLRNELTLKLEGEVIIDEANLVSYSTDASLYQIRPQMVVLPKSQDDIIFTLTLANRHNVPVTSRGGGTSLAGQAIGSGIIIDYTKYYNQILHYNIDEKWAIVQPGLVIDQLNAYLDSYSLLFAPDPATSSRATIGGVIANNSSGTKSIFYGKTIDHLISLKIALIDGTVLQLQELTIDEWLQKERLDDTEGKIYRQFRQLIEMNKIEISEAFPKTMRRVQGYCLDEFVSKSVKWNLAKLICGSEGTLATILEAKIKLVDKPKNKLLLVVHFHSVMEAIQSVEHILKFSPMAIEMLEKSVLDYSKKNENTKKHTHFIQGEPESILIVEFFGSDTDDLNTNSKQCINYLKKNNFGYHYHSYSSPNDQNSIWTVRKKGLGLMLGTKESKKPLAFVEDSAIPITHLPQYIEEIISLCHSLDTKVIIYAHASVGVIHVRPILDLALEKDYTKFQIISNSVFDLVKKYNGSWSGEHGDGLVRSYKLQEFFGQKVYKLLERTKLLFDPKNLMNPGKIVFPQALTDNLRLSPVHKSTQPITQYKFEDDVSFLNMVHLCTGIGACRKKTMGTMCPSFRATSDEIHSTRGRSNLLRLATSEQYESINLLSDELINAMDLCLSCKACKTECPSGVDMAKLKSEVWQMKHDANGISLRDKFLLNSNKVAALTKGWKANFLNTILKSSIFKLITHSVLRLHKKRTLPLYSNKKFANLVILQKKDLKKQVNLFVDTYINHHENNIGRAAIHVLNEFGYHVNLINAGCCQRPRISNGFLKKAKKDGEITIRNLKKSQNFKVPTIVLEPSCCSALKSDLPDLIDIKDSDLFANITTIEEFLLEEIEKKQLKTQRITTAENIHIHQHCHIKSTYSNQSLEILLNILINASINEIPSGCCGMAGAFGYEVEHYQLSMTIAKDSFKDYFLRLDHNDVVLSSGFSCRHQIKDFAHISSKHWIEYYSELMKKEIKDVKN